MAVPYRQQREAAREDRRRARTQLRSDMAQSQASLGQKPRKVRAKRPAQEGGRRPQPQARPEARPEGFDPLAPLSGRDLRREVNTMTRLQYGPQERELAYQRQVQAQRQANVPGWFQDYRNTLGAMQGQIQQAYQAGQQAAYSQANQMFTQQQGALQQQGQQAQNDAALRGQTADQSVQQQALQGAAQAQQMGTAFGGMIGAQGANQQAIMAGEQTRAAGQQLQAQQNEQAQMRKLDQLAAELAGDKGAFKVKARGDLRDSERTYALNRSAFNLDVVQEANDAKQAKAQRKIQRQQLRSLNKDRQIDNRRMSQSERRQQARENREAAKDQYQREQGLGPYKPPTGGKSGSTFTPTQVRANRKTFRNYVYRIKTKVDPPSNVDPLLAQAATQMADTGAVDRKLAKKIKAQYGFTPKTLGRHPKAKIKRRAGRQGGEQFSPNS